MRGYLSWSRMLAVRSNMLVAKTDCKEKITSDILLNLKVKKSMTKILFVCTHGKTRYTSRYTDTYNMFKHLQPAVILSERPVCHIKKQFALKFTNYTWNTWWPTSQTLMTASPQNIPSSKKNTMEAPDTVTNHCSYFPIVTWKMHNLFECFGVFLAVTLSEEVSHLIVVISSGM